MEALVRERIRFLEIVGIDKWLLMVPKINLNMILILMHKYFV